MRKLAVVICGLAVAVASFAQPTDPAGLLRHLLDASPHLRYSGTRVVAFKVGVDRRVHTELILKDGDRTRVEFPKESPDAGQVIVETDRERRHYFPAKNEIRVQPPRREKAFQRLTKLASGPGGRRMLQLADGGNVAGMRTSLVTVTDPRGNPIQKLWIEPKSGLLLKRELYDRSGTLAGGFEFTQVNLNPRVDPRDFILNVKGARVIAPKDDLRTLAARLKLGELQLGPETGFQLDAVRIQKFGVLEALVQQYSNDDRRLTFFQLRGAIDPAKLKEKSRDVPTVSWQRDGVSSVLIGDLPVAQLEDLARRLGKA